jgi:hypothetical protein
MIKAHTSLYRLMAPSGTTEARPRGCDLAGILTDQPRHHVLGAKLGRAADAMTADQEMVGIRRELAVALPDRDC